MGREKEQTSKNPDRPASDAALREYCDKHYHQLLPIIAEKVYNEKVQQEKLKEVKARLNFEGCSGRNSKIQETSQYSESRTPNKRGDLRKRVWFADLPPESIDSYGDLKKEFLATYLQQKKCIKDPVEIHHIKQREGNPRKILCKDSKLKVGMNQQRSERRRDKFTLLTKSPKEILALDKGKFKAPPPRTTPVEKRNSNKFCEFHREAPSGGEKPNGSGHCTPRWFQWRNHMANGANITTREDRRNLDIFTWKPEDITGVPRHLAEHHLNVREGCFPVRQKKRSQEPERNKAIQEEVGKLVDAGIIKEVYYHSWLSNPVMDGYPLPEIDWKVESLCGYPFKCFLDAYKGYHQIKMAKEDEEKTTFITNQGIFCYSKMPFSLKNAGATYQRLVDKAFQKQFCRNLETMEAKAAFKQLKQLIVELPTLTAPTEKEELIVYLEAAKEAVSTVLMTEREEKQMPICFVSRVLQGPEVNYTSMEKLVLALVHASKRLKRYFQAPTIIVITDQPIKQILSKPEVARRMQKWSIELGEYDIKYRPRTSVKGQILADFIVERPKDDHLDTPMEAE
ncbi:reverse transcriptase domain-containing protein [Tanacetum coccineum]